MAAPFHRKGLVKPRPGSGLARALSKLGVCSRTEAVLLIQAGRVRLNGRVCRDPLASAEPGQSQIEVDARPVTETPRCHLALNKPRGLVTTAHDERGRATVFTCLAGAGLPRVFPVGRLDQASEGLLLFTNDTPWANALTDPASGVEKIYHLQVDRLADAELARRFERGADDGGEWLRARRARVLRTGQKTGWLEVALAEGKNRHLRRLALALGCETLRLVRVAIGPLTLGDLKSGSWRALSAVEVGGLAAAAGLTPRES